ncbi:MAG TPA: orotidine 5'-phosphate decarboxylase / HUMPS family protein [Ktedonobacteraceae bacterium]|jgi:3-keto-L-gulonate-6-phosphate decarboxylase|nr:orotidine 5'-phosphate decarboxylase / HUMPS family protein [Ktedonobacteraceae bacterium]
MTVSRSYSLQVAFDLTSQDEALRLARTVAAEGDRLEIGTPWLLTSGLSAIQVLKQAQPHTYIIADCKICDAGEKIAQPLFTTGANAVTIIAEVADQTTWEGVRRARDKVRGHGVEQKNIMADLIGSRNVVEAAQLAERMGADELCVHRPRKVAFGARQQDQETQQLQAILKAVHIPVYLAGGLQIEDIAPLVRLGIAGVIVGSAITAASDPAQAAQSFRQVLL